MILTAGDTDGREIGAIVCDGNAGAGETTAPGVISGFTEGNGVGVAVPTSYLSPPK